MKTQLNLDSLNKSNLISEVSKVHAVGALPPFSRRAKCASGLVFGIF